LFYEIYGAFLKDEGLEKTGNLADLLASEDIKELKQAFYMLLGWVHNKGLTDIFTQKKYDSSDIETENVEKGL
jgi:hypothetical protein